MIFVAPFSYSQIQQQKKSTLLLLQPAVNPLPANILLSKYPGVTVIPQPFLSPNYYVTQLAFFCRQEIKLEKTAKIPFKFRLGSVEDCDRMEGKRRIN